MTLLAGKPPKWDAADATAEERAAIIEATLKLEPDFTGRRPFRIADWSTDLYMTAPKPRRWLVNQVMPAGVAGMLAAAGGTGKGLLILDLALKVAAGPEHPDRIDTTLPDVAFGGRVAEHGAVVILSAEDDRDELHHRIANIDPHFARRKRAQGKLYIIPLPNAGGVQPLVVKKSGALEPTEFYYALKEQLCAIPDLKLTVVDPVAPFVHADINADPQTAAYCMGLFASLATETGSTVLLAAHMSKGDAKKPVTTVEEARALVRGTTALVDGLRFVYALWAADKARADGVFRTFGMKPQRNRLFQGAMVKSNGPADDSIRTYLRDEQSGLLVDITGQIAERTPPPDDLMDALVEDIAKAARELHPFTKTGRTGLAKERKHELRPALRALGDKRLVAMVDELLDRRRVVYCDPVRRAGALDVPGGVYATGREAQVDRAAREFEQEDME